MKLVKTSAIVFAVSAMLSGAAFAQGMSSDSPTRNSPGRAGSGMSTGADTELNSQVDAPGAKAGAGARTSTSTKGTVGSGHGAASGSAGVTDDTAVGTKRH